ncbi:hypothetical protein B0T22DRAFT_464553, partial [Podospora appendiculata]
MLVLVLMLVPPAVSLVTDHTGIPSTGIINLQHHAARCQPYRAYLHVFWVRATAGLLLRARNATMARAMTATTTTIATTAADNCPWGNHSRLGIGACTGYCTLVAFYCVPGYGARVSKGVEPLRSRVPNQRAGSQDCSRRALCSVLLRRQPAGVSVIRAEPKARRPCEIRR